LSEELAQSVLDAAADSPGRAEATRQEVASKALLLLADGASVQGTARQTGQDRATVRALRDRHEAFLRVGREAILAALDQLAKWQYR
jgi:hypothetical protein